MDQGRSRWAEGGGVRVGIHSKELRLVPEGRDRVAVVVAHHFIAAGTCVQRKQVHETTVEGPLLGGVVVVLVGSDRLRTIEPEGVGRACTIGGVKVWIIAE